MRPFGPKRSYPPRVQPAVRRGRPVFRSRTLCHIWPSGPDCLTGSSAELRIGSGMLATRPVRQRGWTCCGGHSRGSCARPVPRALHTHERFPARPGRALVRPVPEKQLRRGVFRSTQELEAAVRRYLEITNQNPRPFVWTKTADEILANIARFSQRTSGTGH